MKNYIVLDIHGNPQVICPRGFIPAEAICEAPAEFDPKQDDPACLVLDNSSDVPVASVDLDIQSASRASKAAAKAAMISAKPMADLRSQRNQLLSVCDWTLGNDSPLSTGKKAEWAAYRQELRDLPGNTEDASAPVWPTKPS